MRFFYAFIISSIAGLSTVVGGLIILFKIKNKKKIITLGLACSAGVMLTLSLIELLPASICNILKNNNNHHIGLVIIIGMLELGMLMVFIINKLIEKGSNNLYKLGILNMLVLIVHNIPEGILSFITTYNNYNIGIKVALAILIHNIPEGISITIPIYYSTRRRGYSILLCIISGLSEPLGALLSYIFIKNKISIINMDILQIIISGLMINLSINKIMPESLKLKKYKELIIGFIIGSLIMTITSIFL